MDSTKILPPETVWSISVLRAVALSVSDLAFLFQRNSHCPHKRIKEQVTIGQELFDGVSAVP